jgi:hypothetical protein
VAPAFVKLRESSKLYSDVNPVRPRLKVPLVMRFGDGSTQRYPNSTVHALVQPSLLVRSPSSHCSEGVRIPSPQTGAQLVPPAQLYPGSTWQSAEHPSPEPRLPSSHCSSVSSLPLPQVSGCANDGAAVSETPLATSHPSQRDVRMYL